MKDLPDYESMEKEYSRVKPMTIQTTPYLQDDTPAKTAIKPLVKLYKIYSSIDTLIQTLLSASSDKELILLASHLSKKIFNNVTTLLSISPLPEKDSIPKLNGYSALVRYALLKSAEGCCSALEYKQQIPYLQERLAFDDITTLHLILLTLTAF